MKYEDEIVGKAIDLANGEIDPVEVSNWAIHLEQENEKAISELEYKVKELLDSLQLAGQLGSNGLLYGTEDFSDWVSQYRKAQRSRPIT